MQQVTFLNLSPNEREQVGNPLLREVRANEWSEKYR